MQTKEDKRTTPPYVSYSSFTSFIKGLGKSSLPSRIDKSVMANYSGSVQYALLPALQWLDLIDDNGKPQPRLILLAGSAENEGAYNEELGGLARSAYHFLFTDDIDLEKATSAQVIEAFRKQKLSGSTATKAISFFLSLAKDGGVSVSPYVKAPKTPRASSPTGKKAKKSNHEEADAESKDSNKDRPEGMDEIRIKVHSQDDWIFHVPKNLTEKQWKQGLKVALFNLENYRQDDED